MKIMKNLLLFTLIVLSSCTINPREQQKSDSGVMKATTTVKTDANGNTSEQFNIIERLKRDNEVGSIKHLYIVSSYSGDILEYSTVKGKVTSGGKRLSPKSVNGNGFNNSGKSNMVIIDGSYYTTDEVLDDGGAYGDSGNYLYWFDAQGNYHQYYPSGGTYIHIADKALRIKRANLSMELIDDSKNK